MATNTKNDVGSGETAAKVTVGESAPVNRAARFRIPKLPRPSKKMLVAGLLILVLIVAGAWSVNNKTTHVGEKVYAQADGHKIYKQDIKNLIGKTSGISNHDAATVLADKYLTEAMAKDAKITVTDKELVAAYGQSINTQKSQQKFYYQRRVNQLYFKKLSATNTGLYKGQFLIASFSRNIPYPSPLLAEEEANDPNLGNPKAIAADKKYAENFLTKLYNQISAHKMTFDQAIKAEHDDPQVGVEAYPTQPHSGSFDTSKANGSLLTADVTAKKLTTIKSGTTTKPFLASTSSGTNKGTSGSYYLVVRMDEARNGSGMPYLKYLDQAKQKYGYKVNV